MRSLYQPSYSQEQATQGLRYPDMLDMNASYDAYAPSHSTGDVQSFQVIRRRLRSFCVHQTVAHETEPGDKVVDALELSAFSSRFAWERTLIV
jgi:polygalacturonase